jgi:hypothetical protein
MNEKIKFENLKLPPDNEKMAAIWDTLKGIPKRNAKVRNGDAGGGNSNQG